MKKFKTFKQQVDMTSAVSCISSVPSGDMGGPVPPWYPPWMVLVLAGRRRMDNSTS